MPLNPFSNVKGQPFAAFPLRLDSSDITGQIDGNPNDSPQLLGQWITATSTLASRRNRAALTIKTIAATHFLDFEELPSAIREKIWNYAIMDFPSRTMKQGRTYINNKLPPVPPFLGVNKQSRALGLKHFKLISLSFCRIKWLLRNETWGKGLPPREPGFALANIYCNFEKDIFEISNRDLFTKEGPNLDLTNFFSVAVLEQMKVLVLHVNWEGARYAADFVQIFVHLYKKSEQKVKTSALKHLVIVFHDLALSSAASMELDLLDVHSELIDGLTEAAVFRGHLDLRYITQTELTEHGKKLLEEAVIANPSDIPFEFSKELGEPQVDYDTSRYWLDPSRAEDYECDIHESIVTVHPQRELPVRER